VSWGLALIPGLFWRGVHGEIGVPTKDHIFQSANFLVCAFVLFSYGADAARARHWRRTLGGLALVLLFLANTFFVATSRTALVVMPVLLLALGWREFRWKGLIGAAILGAVIGAGAWLGSPYLRDRVITSVNELHAYRVKDEPNSTGLHLEFLRKSLQFVMAAPLIGHGTGSIGEQFRESDLAGHKGASATYSDNPHNQIFAVAIQLGLLGTIVLVAMWIAHLLLFTGRGLVAWIGMVVVVQNIVSSLFNSHLFDFTSGWLYVFGVGVVGGMVLRQRNGPAINAAKPSRVS